MVEKFGKYSYHLIEPNIRHAGGFREAEQSARSEGGCVWTKTP